jgi:hypothetical protein
MINISLKILFMSIRPRMMMKNVLAVIMQIFLMLWKYFKGQLTATERFGAYIRDK